MRNPKIPVLFVHKKSSYKRFDGFDCYDIERNAYSYTGTHPVIAHPPCRKFSRLRGLSNAPACEMLSGFWAFALVRRYGGIVEHPYDSQLFKIMKVPPVGKFDSYGGTFLVIDQFDFGYYTRKRTGLYIVGVKRLSELPRPPIRFEPVLRKFEKLSVKQRSETTEDFAKYLAEIIKTIEKWKREI